MIVNDLYCPTCDAVQHDVWFSVGEEPYCRCGTQMRQDWSHGKAPATDLGSPKLYQGLDREFSSTRQAERAAKKVGEDWTRTMQAAGKDFSWQIDGVAGDKRGGARDVTRARGAAFGYAGQARHRSTGEGR